MSIPGVSFYSSLLITSELGDIDRFDRDKEVVSFASTTSGVYCAINRSLAQLRYIYSNPPPSAEYATRWLHNRDDQYRDSNEAIHSND